MRTKFKLCKQRFLIKSLFLLSIILIGLDQISLGQVIIKGMLMRKDRSVPARGVKIIIAPRTKVAEKILDDLFFYGENIEQLRMLNAAIAISDENGIYYFNNVHEGRYILKVCETYGIKYNFSVRRDTVKLNKIKPLVAFYN